MHILKQLSCRLKSGNACCHSVPNLFSSSLVSKNVQFYTSVILRVVLYGCETWSFTLKNECRTRVLRIGC